MRPLIWLLALAVLLAPLPVLGQTPDVVPMELGTPAPWAGLLVKEARFTKFLKLQIEVEELTLKLQIRDRLYGEATTALQAQLSKAQEDLNKKSQPDPWYKSHWFIWCVGLVIGMGVAVGAFYGAAQLGK